MDNLRYYEQLKTVPENAQKPIKAGRLKGMTDINPMWRIKALTETFGPVGFGWYYKVTDKRIEIQGQESSAFVDIELYYKVNDEWSMPVIGTGGSSFVTVENSGNVYMSDECFKMALTDAISVACKALGVGADIYWNITDSKYLGRNDKSIVIHGKTVTELSQIKVGFGKYSDLTLKELYDDDQGYMTWLMDNAKDENMKKASKAVYNSLKKKGETK